MKVPCAGHVQTVLPVLPFVNMRDSKFGTMCCFFALQLDAAGDSAFSGDSGGLGTIAMDLFTLNDLSLCFFSVRPSDQ
jgi:hypothetical protein